MFPYNKAVNRSIRRSKNRTNMEDEEQNSIENSPNKEEEIHWDFEEYRLTYVLDNFKLPQIVRVVEGFMFTEEDSLASGTILTLHGQQKIEQVCAIDQKGFGNEVFIPLSCPYRVRVTVPDREKIYKTVKDLCNATPLPKCVLVNEKISVGGVKILSGRWLIVKSISKSKNDQAEGICVELLDDRIRTLVLPLKVVGNFASCPLPADQGRNYFIRELCDRSFPIWVAFLPSNERNPPYGPHMGTVKLIKLQTIDVVFSTTEIGGRKFAISFSRSLPVTVEAARGMLDSNATYSRRCKAAEEEIDLDVLSHLADANPYSSMYQSAIYADICAIRKAFQHKNDMCKNLSHCSSDSFHSDTTSFSEDRISEVRYNFDRTVHSNGSITSSQQYEMPVAASSSESVDSTHLVKDDFKKGEHYSQPPYIYLDPKANVVQSHTSEDSNSDEEHEYEIIAEKMDENITKPIKQSTKSQPYCYVDVTPLKLSPRNEQKGDFEGKPLVPPKERPKVPPRKNKSSPRQATSPPRKTQSLTSSNSSIDLPEPYSSKRNLSRTLSEGCPDVFIDGVAFDKPFSETHVNEKQKPIDSDTESVLSDYHSVKSIPDALASATVSQEKGVESEPKRMVPRKPERPKGPPKPIPRHSSLKNKDSVCSNPSLLKSKNNGEGVVESSPLKVTVENLGSKTKEGIQVENNEERSEERSGLKVKNGEEKKEDKSGNVAIGMDEKDANEYAQDKSSKNEDEGNKDEKNENIMTEEKDSNCCENTVDDLDEDGVGKILDEIQLSDFKDIFKGEQINGALLAGLDIETLISLGLNTFEAIKVVTYVQGWRPNEDDANEANANEANATEANVPAVLWSTKDVFVRMQEINLKSLAEFCIKNQVDGKLLESVIDNEGFECLKTDYSVQINKLHERKIIKYVKQGWRPDSTLKRK